MSHKSGKIAEMIAEFQGQAFPPHYLGYFHCFNQQLFYEAHDVLEDLWLQERGQPNDLFFKGLIQLAGAFVHLQKNRLGPAESLFKLAEKNIGPFGPAYLGLKIDEVMAAITDWRGRLAVGDFKLNPYAPESAPRFNPQPSLS